MSDKKSVYKKVLLKISGETFLNYTNKNHFQQQNVDTFINSIQEILALDLQLAIVVGAGNFLRGKEAVNINRVRADHIGMISTVINGLFLQDLLESKGYKVKLLSSFTCGSLVENYFYEKANNFLEQGFIVIFVGGTGSCYFSTDTAAAIRALEIGADILLKGTKVEGVYDKDPLKNENAQLFKKISYTEFLRKELKVIDETAVILCRNNKLPISVFNIFEEKILKQVILDNQVGTLISGE